MNTHPRRNGNGNHNRKVLMIIDEAAVRVGDKIYCGGTETLFWCNHFKSFGHTLLSIPTRNEDKYDPAYPHLLSIPENAAISPRRFYSYKMDALMSPRTYLYNCLADRKSVV